MKIKVIEGDREIYRDLMMIADPAAKSIDEYIHIGTLIGIFDKETCIGICHYSDFEDNKASINNVSLSEGYQGKGIGTKLLKYTVEHIFTKGFDSIVLGTGNSSIRNIAFYQKNGFDLTELWYNYFIDNFDEEIFENGIQCKHMLRFECVKN